MQDILTFGRKSLYSHKYIMGSVAMVELTETMYAVIVTDNQGWLVLSKNFPFTKNCKKEVFKSCKSFYNFAKDCVCKRKFELLEDQDD